MTTLYAAESGDMYQTEDGLYLALDDGVLFREDLEGPHLTNITTDNSGFTIVNVLAGGAFVFHTGTKLFGTSSGHMDAINTAITVVSEHAQPNPIFYRRFYIYVLTPSIVIGLSQAQSGAAAGGQIRLDTLRQIVMRNGTTSVGTSGAIPLDWVRVEQMVNTVTSTQELRLFYGANLHTNTPSQTPLVGAYTQGQVSRVQYGNPVAADFDMYLDGIVESVAGWVGPAV